MRLLVNTLVVFQLYFALNTESHLPLHSTSPTSPSHDRVLFPQTATSSFSSNKFTRRRNLYWGGEDEAGRQLSVDSPQGGRDSSG